MGCLTKKGGRNAKIKKQSIPPIDLIDSPTLSVEEIAELPE